MLNWLDNRIGVELTNNEIVKAAHGFNFGIFIYERKSELILIGEVKYIYDVEIKGDKVIVKGKK